MQGRIFISIRANLFKKGYDKYAYLLGYLHTYVFVLVYAYMWGD